MKKTIVTTLMILFIASASFATEETMAVDSHSYELTTYKVNPFCMAIIKGDLETVKKMIALGSDVNQRSDGKTPLMYAARYNRVDIIRLLVEEGAYLKARDSRGNTAMKFAELSNAKEAMAVLKELS
ncbi:ankyrin repeat domain-containing protein [Aquimarina rubra]|uniref:Ankyrin repeat domain-containing protein n=1 Tax=Aquimarina rubra TaxID=1920033 RepID=A0ABW5LI16_9FLAO